MHVRIVGHALHGIPPLRHGRKSHGIPVRTGIQARGHIEWRAFKLVSEKQQTVIVSSNQKPIPLAKVATFQPNLLMRKMSVNVSGLSTLTLNGYGCNPSSPKLDRGTIDTYPQSSYPIHEHQNSRSIPKSS